MAASPSGVTRIIGEFVFSIFSNETKILGHLGPYRFASRALSFFATVVWSLLGPTLLHFMLYDFVGRHLAGIKVKVLTQGPARPLLASASSYVSSFFWVLVSGP